MGRHFYHWLNFRGAGNYWTKVIIDTHPQHEVSKTEDPGDNPTMPDHNYIEGLTRFYFKITANSLNNPWSVWIDEIDIYHDPRPMPPKIASVAITHLGANDFEIDFASVDRGDGDEYVNRYEVRYSTTPINSANYSSAKNVSGSPAITGDWERYAHCEAYDLAIDGADIVYFAIRQLYENTEEIAFVQYEMGSVLPQPADNLMILE
ncbi:MAG: hypothetical protein PF692_05420 [Kiritimatiellae bacterium]|nr:hypothetical protein [Kiritimatiellia bacterium]